MSFENKNTKDIIMTEEEQKKRRIKICSEVFDYPKWDDGCDLSDAV